MVQADKGWYLTRSGVIMNWLCVSTVWGMASGRLSHLGWSDARSPRYDHPYRYSDEKSLKLENFIDMSPSIAPELILDFYPGSGMTLQMIKNQNLP